MKNRLNKFMYGRYGNDNYNRFLLAASAVLLLAGVLSGLSLLVSVAFAVIVLVYIRMLSKNIVRRSEENRKYLSYKYRLFAFLKGIKERFVQRKDYKFFRCPSCHVTLRVPRGRGKIKIVCRKCGYSFIGKS